MQILTTNLNSQAIDENCNLFVTEVIELFSSTLNIISFSVAYITSKKATSFPQNMEFWARATEFARFHRISTFLEN